MTKPPDKSRELMREIQEACHFFVTVRHIARMGEVPEAVIWRNADR